MPNAPRLAGSLSLMAVLSLIQLAGCSSGDTKSSQATSQPSLPSGTEILYVHQSRMLMGNVTSASGELGALQYACPEDIYGPPQADLNYQEANWAAPPSLMVSPPGGKYLFVAGLDPQTGRQPGIWVYSIAGKDQGSLFPVTFSPYIPATPFNAPQGMVLDGLGRHLYFADRGTYNGLENTVGLVREFTFPPASSDFQESPSTSTGPAANFSLQAADAVGKYLYGWFNDTAGNLAISVFALDPSTGAPTQIPGSPFLVEAASNTWPFGIGTLQFGGLGMALSPSGRYLYASVESSSFSPTAGESTSGSIYTFAVNPDTGALTQVAGSPVSLGDSNAAIWLVVHPNGKFLYASTSQSSGSGPIDGISVYPIDGANGAIPPVPETSTVDKNCCRSLLLDPDGVMLLDESQKGTWSTFKVDGSSGALTATGTQTPDVQEGGSGVIVRTP